MALPNFQDWLPTVAVKVPWGYYRAIGDELKDNGPRCNALALGAVQTEMLAEAFVDYKAPVSASQMANYIADFSLNGHHLYNGKVLPISQSTP